MALHLPHAELVFARGRNLSAQIEDAPRDEQIDHVWISMECGLPAPLLVSINTLSIKCRNAGLDPRVRVGVIWGNCKTFPQIGFGEMERFDYEKIETTHNVFYETLDRSQMEELLLGLSSGAEVLEVWGAPYRRKGREGIHQIHSRRAGPVVTEDLVARDGGLKFFHQKEGHPAWAMVLIKFFGQP